MKSIPVDMDEVLAELVQIYQVEILLLGPVKWMENLVDLKAYKTHGFKPQKTFKYWESNIREYLLCEPVEGEQYLIRGAKPGTHIREALRNRLREAYGAETT